MITSKQLLEPLEGESAPKCAAANGGVQCDQPVATWEEPFPNVKVHFCQQHGEGAKARRHSGWTRNLATIAEAGREVCNLGRGRLGLRMIVLPDALNNFGLYLTIARPLDVHLFAVY